VTWVGARRTRCVRRLRRVERSAAAPQQIRPARRRLRGATPTEAVTAMLPMPPVRRSTRTLHRLDPLAHPLSDPDRRRLVHGRQQGDELLAPESPAS